MSNSSAIFAELLGSYANETLMDAAQLVAEIESNDPSVRVSQVLINLSSEQTLEEQIVEEYLAKQPATKFYIMYKSRFRKTHIPEATNVVEQKEGFDTLIEAEAALEVVRSRMQHVADGYFILSTPTSPFVEWQPVENIKAVEPTPAVVGEAVLAPIDADFDAGLDNSDFDELLNDLDGGDFDPTGCGPESE